MIRPRIKESYDVIPEDVDRYQIRSSEETTVMKGATVKQVFSHLLPLLDGENTEEAIAEKLGAVASAGLVHAVIEKLRGAGVVEDAASDEGQGLSAEELEAYRRQLVFLDLTLERGSAVQAQLLLKNARLSVIGGGELAVAVALEAMRAGVGRILGANIQSGASIVQAGNLSDKSMSGTSVIKVKSTDGPAGRGKAVDLFGSITTDYPYGFAGLHIPLTKSDADVMDVSGFKGLRFAARGDGQSYMVVMITQGVKDFDDFSYLFKPAAEWTTLDIPFTRLKQLGFGAPMRWSGKDLKAIRFQIQTFGPPSRITSLPWTTSSSTKHSEFRSVDPSGGDMTNSFKSAMAMLALVTGIMATADASAQPASGQTGAQTAAQTGAKTGKSAQDPRAARILRNFQAGRKVLIQTSASEPVMKDFDKAEQQFADGDLDGALTRLEAALKREARKTTFRVIWSAYDRITEDYEKFDRCVSFMQTLVNAYPNVPDVRAGLASAYGVKASNLQKTKPAAMKDVIRYGNLSVDQLDVALALDPETFMARLARGITFSYEPARLAEAEEDFDKLLSLQAQRKNPWYPYYIVYYFYGDALKRGNNLTRAREVLTLGLHYYPVNDDLKRLFDEVNKLGANR